METDYNKLHMFIAVLKEKFLRTYSERTESLAERLLNLQDVMGEDCEKIWDNFHSLVTEFGELSLHEHSNYLLTMIFLGSLSKNKKLTEEERRRMIEKIENDRREPKAETDLMKSLRIEFIRSKIEGKRTGIVADTVWTFFAQNRFVRLKMVRLEVWSWRQRKRKI